MKNIWIMNHYATNMFFQQAGRHYSFAKELKKRGYEPIVFTASSKHRGALTSSGVVDSIELGCKLYTKKMSTHNLPFVFVRTNNYKGNSIGRIVNMLLFAINLFISGLLYSRKHPKPDVIYASSAHLFTCVTGIILAKIFSVKCVCEVRDLWPLSFVELGLASKDSLAVRLLYRLEKWIYTKADRLIFTMEGGEKYIYDQKWYIQQGGTIDQNKVFHINNGVDLKLFNYNQEHYQIQDADLDDTKTFKVVYTGTLGIPNNVINILEIAEQLRNENIKFLIWGTGSEVEKIKKTIVERKLYNVIYKGSVEKKYIPYILSKSDLNIILGKTLSLYRYGTSQNKLFDYLASARPILCTRLQEYSIIKKYNAGYHIDETDKKKQARAILDISTVKNSDAYALLCKNAQQAAEVYDFIALTNKLEKILTF